MHTKKFSSIILVAIAFMLTYLTSCTEGGTLEITNGDPDFEAHVGVWFEDGAIESKDIAPGQTGIWSFSKNGTVYYGYSFNDSIFDTPSMQAISFTAMGGEVTRITIKP